MLTQGFKTHFPHVPIIGEESTEYTEGLDIDYSQLAEKENSFFPSYVGMSEYLTLRESMESCLWIDPLDCTRGFIHGNPEDVTVLIGLSVGKKAHFGIVGTPFKKHSGKVYYDPSIVFGSVGAQ